MRPPGDPGAEPPCAGPTQAEALRHAARRLATGSATAALDAALLLAYACDRPRSHAIAHPDARLDAASHARFTALVARRARGEPLAYLTGEREFWSLGFEVDASTLVPRPETERLVELALEGATLDAPLEVVDLGTGSGAIAIAIATEAPAWSVLATDCSAAALAVARRNAARHQARNVDFARGSWWAAVGDRRFDLVLANPPYVAENDPHLDGDGVRFEPREALAAGHDGLAAIREIARGASNHLRPGGRLLLEHGHDQGDAVAALLAAVGLREVSTHRDHAGVGRITGGILNTCAAGS